MTIIAYMKTAGVGRQTVLSKQRRSVQWGSQLPRRRCSETVRMRARQGIVLSAAAERRLMQYNKAARLSAAVSQLEPSKTVAISDLAKSMMSEGHDVISLAVGEPDFPTPDPIAEAGMEAIQSGFTKYTQNSGLPELQAAIRQKLKRDNELEYANEEIIVSNGAKQAALQAIMATCGPGDEVHKTYWRLWSMLLQVLIPAPYWVSYPQMVTLANATAKILPCPISDGFLLQPDALRSALTPKSRLLILCTPSNPTGAMYNREQLEGIADVVMSHPNLLVLSDEIYEYIAYPPAEHVSFASLPGMHERTLTVNGFSKGFAMTGWRLGYLAAPLPYAKACATIQSHCTSCPCSISQKAGIAALNMGNKGGTVISDMVHEYQSRRDYLLQRLRSISGIGVLEPQGAFYLFPDVTAFVGKGVTVDGFGEIDNVDQLCKYLVQQALVATIPGSAFGAEGHIRISYATSMEQLEKAMDRLERAFAAILPCQALS